MNCLDRDPYRFGVRALHHFIVFTTTDPMDPHQLASGPARVSLDSVTEEAVCTCVPYRLQHRSRTGISGPTNRQHSSRFFINKHPRFLHHRLLHLRLAAIMHLYACIAPCTCSGCKSAQNDLSIRQTGTIRRSDMTSVDLEPYRRSTFHNVVHSNCRHSNSYG